MESTACHLLAYATIYVGVWLTYSFALQAYVRMLIIIHPRRTQLRSFKMILIVIGITCFVSLVLVIPTIFLNIIIYEPNEYQCLIDLRGWKRNVYMVSVMYSVPQTIIITIYIQVLKFVRESTLRNEQYLQTATMRNVIVLKRIVTLVCVLIILGVPALFFWILTLITGYVQPLAYRIQIICVAFDLLTLSFAVALTNPQVKTLLPFFKKHQVGITMTAHPQRQLINIPAQES